MQRIALTAGGMLDATGRWNGPLAQKYNVHNEVEFRANPVAQEAAFAAYMKVMETEIINNGIHRNIGQTIQGRAANFEITFPGLMAADHRLGTPMLLDYILFQRAHDWQSERITTQSVQDWYKENRRRTLSKEEADRIITAFNRIETRMRTFSDKRYFSGGGFDPSMPAGPLSDDMRLLNPKPKVYDKEQYNPQL